MSTSQTGLIAGLVLGLAVMSGFGTFLVVVAAGIIGFVVGRVVDGQLSIGDLFGRGRDR